MTTFAALLLAGCSNVVEGRAVISAPRPGSPIQWAPCKSATSDEARIPGGAECGLLSVPVDYSKPDGDVAQIAMLRIKATGKKIRHIGKSTMEQLEAYNWPGNIRELQNVVERAVILTEGDTFIVDESWLKRESADSSPHEGLSALQDREVEMIEAALAESHGRISGPAGAAARLGIPRQTLESKMRLLGIDKYGQK